MLVQVVDGLPMVVADVSKIQKINGLVGDGNERELMLDANNILMDHKAAVSKTISEAMGEIKTEVKTEINIIPDYLNAEYLGSMSQSTSSKTLPIRRNGKYFGYVSSTSSSPTANLFINYEIPGKFEFELKRHMNIPPNTQVSFEVEIGEVGQISFGQTGNLNFGIWSINFVPYKSVF